MLHREVSGAVIGCAIRVHQHLGPGLLESAYQKCLAYEAITAGMEIETQKPIPLVYGNVRLKCGYRADLIANGIVLVEIKAISEWHPIFEAQMISYLKLTNLKAGLWINFNVRRLKDGIRRYVN